MIIYYLINWWLADSNKIIKLEVSNKLKHDESDL